MSNKLMLLLAISRQHVGISGSERCWNVQAKVQLRKVSLHCRANSHNDSKLTSMRAYRQLFNFAALFNFHCK